VTSVGTVGQAVAAATDSLKAAGCSSARLDAELLLADAMGMRREDVVAHPERPVPPDAARVAMNHVRRRARREPVAYITGRRWFRRLELRVDHRALIPRPQSEMLVDVVTSTLSEGASLLDLGTGSGSIALAVKDERPDVQVSGSDISADAIALARENAERLGLDVELFVADGYPAGRSWDMVVANLPYLRDDEWADRLPPEIVGFEPRVALTSGADGLGAIRDLIRDAPAGTRLALEHAPDQAAAIRALLTEIELPELPDDFELITVGRVA